MLTEQWISGTQLNKSLPENYWHGQVNDDGIQMTLGKGKSENFQSSFLSFSQEFDQVWNLGT